MIIKNIHEKLLNSVQTMLIDTKVNLPFYGEYCLHISFHEQESVGTCGVNITTKGFNFYYSPSFLENISQKEVNFITIHELFHLLFAHPQRTVTGQYDHKMSNIAQDMIINHIIWEDISHSFVEIPKSKDGNNMALFVPKDYKGKLIFEELYEYLKDEKDKWQKEKKKNECQSCKGSGKDDNQSEQSEQSDKQESDCSDCKGTGNENGKDSSGKPSYGPYGKSPSKEGGYIDTWSTEQIFEDMETNNGEYLDKHIGDGVPEEMREAMVKDVMERLASRGLTAGNIETTLNKLRKKRKDYLKEIKRSISNMIFGSIKQKTIVKPNRRQIFGLKGNRKVKTMVNVILDSSGSMGGQGTFEKVLSYVYRNDIEINFMESDTEIKWVQNLKSKRALEKIPIKGLGGTVMQTGLDYVVKHFNNYNTVLLTDGYTDTLDCSKLKGKLLIISVGTKCPIGKSNGKVKQILIEK
jgi:predicted metal-dependent peptidase